MNVCRFPALCSAVATFAVSTATASAYTVKTSSSGAPVHWTAADVEFIPALTPGPATVTTDDAKAAIAVSAETWRTALTGSELTTGAAQTSATPAVHTNDGFNTVRWALDQNDPDIERGVLALTFVAYRTSDGVIEDADVVLNAADFTWATSMAGCTTQYDLESALTHELGHALGLAHSLGHPEATMYATGDACETIKRDLSADDQAGLASLYPVSTDSQAGGCSTSGSGGLGGMVGVLAVALMVGRKRRAAAAAVVVGLVGFAASAEASQLRYLDLADLGQHADVVVRGHVVAVTAVPGDLIETDSEIAVDDCMTANCPATVHVVRRGGERDGKGLWVDGEAVPELGSHVVVYLRNDTRGHLRVLGGVQGMLHVVQTAQGSFAVRDLRGHHVRVDGSWQPGQLEAVGLDTVKRSVARPAQ